VSVKPKNPLNSIAISKFRSAPRQIAEQLRTEISAGRFAPGARLPTAVELAAIWKVSTFTVHKAMTLLVTSGQLVRLRGTGTFVAENSAQLKNVALYYGHSFFSQSSGIEIYHLLNQALGRQLAAKNVTNQVYIDSRAEGCLTSLPEALVQAVESRKVQAIIAPMLTNRDAPLIQKLPIPTALLSNRNFSNNIYFDFRQFFDVALTRLAENGCRDVALIAAPSSRDEDTTHLPFLRYFLELAAKKQLTIRDEWIHVPDRVLPNAEMESFGRKSFLRLWAQPQRPSGLIVYPDVLARGVVWALNQKRVAIPQELHLVFHRNEGLRFACPYPATWLTTNIEALASSLIHLIDLQMHEESIPPICLPFGITQEKGDWDPS